MHVSKQQMIAAIRQCNQSATDEYLIRFDEETLYDYLKRLTTLHNHRGRDTKWVRSTTDRAVVTRVAG